MLKNMCMTFLTLAACSADVPEIPWPDDGGAPAPEDAAFAPDACVCPEHPACRPYSCESGACAETAAPKGTTCVLDDGSDGVCDGTGLCVEPHE